MSTALLSVEGLSKFFSVRGGFFGREVASVRAVDNVSFDIRKGETLGLVGESGCGKSTLGRTILRLLSPTAGKVLFRGQDITRLSPRELRPIRRQIQIVFQDPFSSLNPRMTVGSILAEPFIIHNVATRKERDHRVAELVETVGLDLDALERFPHEFSGGQRQRIGVARAIALRPELVIADEPVSALDVSIQSQVLNLLSDLRSSMGLSYLFISHDLAVVEHISDYVAVMYLGRIVEHARADTFYQQARHPYSKMLLEAIPIPEFSLERRKRRVEAGGDVPSPMDPPKGCHFHPRCPIASQECKVRAPELKNVGSGSEPRYVACHYA